MIRATDIVIGYSALRQAQGPGRTVGVLRPFDRLTAAQAQGLGRTVGEHVEPPAVAGPLSFSHADGECVMLRGRNGSGKTTLMKTLAGLLPPISGTFETGGKAILVPTRIPKVRGFTVEEFVRTGTLSEYGAFRKLDEYSKKAIDDAMAMMELGDLAAKDISRVSDGEFQKACIAAALTRKANVLMLDEPTAFLDVENRVMVLQNLQRLAHETGATVLFSTHDIHDGTLYSDSVLAL